MSMGRYMSGNPADTSVDQLDTTLQYQPDTTDYSQPQGGGTGGIFDLLGNYGTSYFTLQQTQANAQAQQALAQQNAPIQLASLANSKLLIIGVVLLGFMFLSKKH